MISIKLLNCPFNIFFIFKIIKQITHPAFEFQHKTGGGLSKGC